MREAGSGWFCGPLVDGSDRAVRICCGQSSGACGGEGTQGLQLSPGVRAVSGLRLSCASLRESVRSWDGAALTGLLSCLQALSCVCGRCRRRSQALPWARMASVGLGVLAAPPTTPRRAGCPLWRQCRAGWGGQRLSGGTRPLDALAHISGWTPGGS